MPKRELTAKQLETFEQTIRRLKEEECNKNLNCCYMCSFGHRHSKGKTVNYECSLKTVFNDLWRYRCT